MIHKGGVQSRLKSKRNKTGITRSSKKRSVKRRKKKTTETVSIYLLTSFMIASMESAANLKGKANTLSMPRKTIDKDQK
jgi:hypothetical protein